jgi:hypothetical protein
LTKLGCYVYATYDKAVQYWNTEEILEEWPNTKLAAPNPDGSLNSACVDGLPYTFGGWREREVMGMQRR